MNAFGFWLVNHKWGWILAPAFVMSVGLAVQIYFVAQYHDPWNWYLTGLVAAACIPFAPVLRAAKYFRAKDKFWLDLAVILGYAIYIFALAIFGTGLILMTK